MTDPLRPILRRQLAQGSRFRGGWGFSGSQVGWDQEIAWHVLNLTISLPTGADWTVAG